MKKLLSILLTICIASSFGIMLTSCDEHDHEFSEEWEFDSINHWHECIVDNCSKASDKSGHIWSESVDGEDTYLCTVCGALKGFPVNYEEWTAALDQSLFTNVTISYSIKENDVTKTYVAKIADGKLYKSEEIGGNTSHNWYDGKEAKTHISETLGYFVSPLLSSNFYFLPYVEDGDGFYLTRDLISELTGEFVGVIGMITVSNDFTSSFDFEGGEEVVSYTVRKGRVKFDSEGSLISFSGMVNKRVSVVEMSGDENNKTYKLNTISESTEEVSFEFSDYGATVLPNAEN